MKPYWHFTNTKRRCDMRDSDFGLGGALGSACMLIAVGIVVWITLVLFGGY